LTRHHWEVWLWTCVFALLPFLLWLLLVHVIGVEANTGAADASRELLFFSLTIGTIALSELRNVDAAKRTQGGYETLYSGSIIDITVSAAMYGVFLSVHGKPEVLARILPFSLVFAVMGFAIGTGTQVFIHGGVTHEEH
jgi:hypothetical protein